MGNRLTKHLIIDIGMRINMDQPHRPVLAGHGTQHWQAESVIAAEGQRHNIMCQHLVIEGRDTCHRVLEVKGVDWHIAKITHPK